jgi:hypothetical protein
MKTILTAVLFNSLGCGHGSGSIDSERRGNAGLHSYQHRRHVVWFCWLGL